MKTLKYDDGINIEYTAGTAWEDESGDVESTASKHRVTLPAGSLAAIEESLAIAAARCVAADAFGLTLDFGPNSQLKYTGRTVGAGTTCEWLEVRMRLAIDTFGKPMAIAHLSSALKHAIASQQITMPEKVDVANKMLAFLSAIADKEIVGARDEHSEWRRSISERAQASDLRWFLEDAASSAGVLAAD